jgi:Baseplate J-like protein
LPLPTQPIDAILTRVRAFFRTSFPGFPMGLKKFLGRTSRAVGLSVWQLQKSVEDIDQDIVPSPLSSTDALSAWATLLGLPDGAGGFGRLLPTTASGGKATLTGVIGTAYGDGLIAVAEDGTTQIELSGAVVIPGVGTGFGAVQGAFLAVTPGIVGNLPKGTVCTWQSAPPGADPTFTLTSALGGGNDTEDNPAVYGRILARLQTPPRGGVAEDFRLWAGSVTGIVGVYVYPRRGGTGTVDLVVTAGGAGQNRRPTATQLADAQTAVDTLRPVGADQANVLSPYMPDNAGHVVRVRVVPSSAKYNFDWDDTAAPLTVFAYDPTPPSPKLTLNTVAPASLLNAIDSYLAATGPKPRLQVMSTGVVFNVPIGVVQKTAVAGPRTQLTLETPPFDWVQPTVGDTVYAYGPVVATIAEDIQLYVDALGPSRESGYGDPLTPWIDTLAISGLISIAQTAADSDGTQLVSEVPPGQATIDGVPLDVQADDSTPNSPELLYVKHIAVTG